MYEFDAVAAREPEGAVAPRVGSEHVVLDRGEAEHAPPRDAVREQPPADPRQNTTSAREQHGARGSGRRVEAQPAVPSGGDRGGDDCCCHGDGDTGDEQARRAGDNECPHLLLDTDGDGRINTIEGVPAYGPVVLALFTTGDTTPGSFLDASRFPVAENGSYDYSRDNIEFTDAAGTGYPGTDGHGTARQTADAIRAGEGVLVIRGLDSDGSRSYSFSEEGASELPGADGPPRRRNCRLRRPALSRRRPTRDPTSGSLLARHVIFAGHGAWGSPRPGLTESLANT